MTGRPTRLQASRRAGFTLAEVAVTVVIVGVVLVVAVQGLNNSLFQASHTRNIKIARELGLLTLGKLESGMYIEDIEDHMHGDYADQEHTDFTWELVLGSEPFYDDEQLESGRFDSWDPGTTSDEDESESTEPWVVARVKVGFPSSPGRRSDIVLERWITREFAYGEDDEEEGVSQ